jgi:uncharacterized membrane protein YeaQ/YmgE (transglycosylase-associated protein family)
MNALPIFMSGLLGWTMGHLVGLCDRHSGWLRMLNYPVGIAGATIGAMISQNLPSLHNKQFVMGILFAALALLLFQSARRLLAAHSSYEPSVD